MKLAIVLRGSGNFGHKGDFPLAFLTRFGGILQLIVKLQHGVRF